MTPTTLALRMPLESIAAATGADTPSSDSKATAKSARRMKWLAPAFLGWALAVAPAIGDSAVREIFAAEAGFAAAVARADEEALDSLLTNDVRFVRSESITFTAVSAKARLGRLFGLSPGSGYSRSPETIKVAQSDDLAFVTGTQQVSAKKGGSRTSRYLSIWRQHPDFEKEWRLAFDAPLEVWRGLDNSLSVDAVSHTPGLLVVNLAPSSDAEQLEPATFRQSAAHDLACSVGSYYVSPPADDPEAAVRWGHFLATWEYDGAEWKLLHASFPEPKGTSVP